MLGAIVTSFNDGYKIREWRNHFEEMKSIIDEYVIVDNGSSDKEYLSTLKDTFPEAEIVELSENKGTTGAYNTGISLLLNNPEIRYIMLIGNDIRISAESIRKQISFLEEHEDVGMVTATLLKKDSMIVEDGGCSIDNKEYSLIPHNVGMNYSELSRSPVLVDTVTGGMNIAKREFYETVGLQDEQLFMYSDEVDMGLRAKNNGIKMFMVSESVAWHQHINPQNTVLRHPYSAYLMARNKIYLAKKHGTKLDAGILFIKYILRDSLHLIKAVAQHKEEKSTWFKWHMYGAVYGIKGDMEKNKYSSLEG